MDKFLQQLADRLQIPDSEIITADETKDWPTGKLDELVEAGVLAEIQHSKGVVCRECEENCFIEPDIRTNPDTGKASGIFVCTRNPDIGRIEVDLDRLRQWQINSEKLPKPKKINKTATYSRKNQKQNEKTLIVSTLLEYHRFGMDSEFNFELLKQEKLGEVLEWKQSKVSRALKRSFPKGFWKRYKQACKADILKGFLKILDDEQTAPEAVYYRPQHPTDHEEKLARQYE